MSDNHSCVGLILLCMLVLIAMASFRFKQEQQTIILEKILIEAQK
jgi:hypothetical protein